MSLETTARTVYVFDCPACGGVTDLGDVDPEGEQQCDDCGAPVTITGVTQ